MATRIEARRAEIAREYRRRRRRKRAKPTLAELRRRDLMRIFRFRYGLALPDDDAGRHDAALMLRHIAANRSGARKRMIAWLELWAPWADTGRMIADALAAPRKLLSADELAAALGLTAAARRRLGVTSIGAIDETRADRAAHRRERARLAKERKRRAAGAVPRAVYLEQCRARPKPWIAAGISRATWYRQRAALVGCNSPLRQ
jgi:hypothetical protein